MGISTWVGLAFDVSQSSYLLRNNSAMWFACYYVLIRIYKGINYGTPINS